MSFPELVVVTFCVAGLVGLLIGGAVVLGIRRGK